MQIKSMRWEMNFLHVKIKNEDGRSVIMVQLHHILICDQYIIVTIPGDLTWEVIGLFKPSGRFNFIYPVQFIHITVLAII